MFRAALVAGALLVASDCAIANELEVGIGVFGISTPHYLGSSQTQRYVVPMPYINYKSERLEINRERLSGLLWHQGDWYLDASLAASFAVDSKDNDARKDMPDLGWTFEIGPSLDYYFKGSPQDSQSAKVGFFTRKAISTDFSSLDDIGWRYGPKVVFKQQFDLAGGHTLAATLKLSSSFATARYNQNFYGVSEQDVTPVRHLYQASSGYVGSDVSLGLSYNTAKFWYGGFIKYAWLNGSNNEISPLFKQQHNLSIGIGFAWKFITQRK